MVASEVSAALAAPALLEALPDTVVVADRDGRIAYVSPPVQTLLGHRAEDLTGRSLTVLMPQRLRRGHGDGFSRYRATGQGKLVGATTRVPALHADGHEVPIDLTLSRLAVQEDGDDSALVVAVLRDASTTVLLERQFQVSRYLAAIQRVTAALTEAPSADAAFEQLLSTICTELDWDAGMIWQPDESTDRLHYVGAWAAPEVAVPTMEAQARSSVLLRGQGLPGVTWQERTPVVFEDLWTDPRFTRRVSARADGIRTGLAFPVLHGDTLLGVCELFSREARSVPADLLDVLATAGRQIGQFLGRLRAESQVRSLAETLQRSLLPPSLPVIPGVDLAARYRAGGEGLLVGGDTYDVLPLPDGSWMVLIADVCGKGAEAAGTASLARHTARAAATRLAGPADVLGAVNSALIGEAGAGPLRFVTACCLMLRPHDSGVSARLSIAGHPRPVLRSPDGTCTEVGAPDRPLGVAVDTAYAEVDVDLSPRSCLVLYTDGVTEARDVTGTLFDEAGLLRVLSRNPLDSAEATVEAVQAAVDRHRQGSRHERDDLAVLALRC
jgi:phosphoserine phosphatase RsbU/P